MSNVSEIVKPYLPEKPTQRDYIIAYLMTGRVLTRSKTVYLMHFFEAPARISELKQMGYPIRTAEVKITTRLGRSSKVAIWYLDTVWMEKNVELRKFLGLL